MRHRATIRATAGGAIRTAEFRGKKHLVVPIVAMKEGVIFASNSDAPELVLASEFQQSPEGWNGRPVVMDHPSDADGEPILANDPRVLERVQMGSVFATTPDGDSLKMEAWLDPDMVATAGEDATRAVERINAGETVDVSVGVLVNTEKKSGVYKGKKYAGVWRDIVPDHLAILHEGLPGACSVDMGCGTRAAAKKGESMTLRERLRELRKKLLGADTIVETGESDDELRMQLSEALYATEPGFLGVHAVYQDKSQVAYCVAPEGALIYKLRSFSKTGDEVSLKDDAEEVEMVTRFEKKSAAASSCGCSGEVQNAAKNKEEPMITKAQLVARILAAKDSPYDLGDVKTLEALSDEKLKKIGERLASEETSAPVKEETKVETPAAPAAPVVAPVVVPTPAVPVVAPANAAGKTEEAPVKVETPAERRERLLAENPDIRQVLDSHNTTRAARHAELCSALKDNKVFSDGELKAMSLEQLEKVASIAGKNTKAASAPAVDFGGNGLPREQPGSDKVPEVKSATLAEQLRAARGKKSA